MRNISGITILVGIMVCGSIGLAAAQSSAEESRDDDSATEAAVASQSADDTLEGVPDTTKKKGGGLFGKVKSVAKNKVVQQVAKTAACTMLPGGQVVAGAIDAAANKDAVGAAAGAATGSTCMPGMGGAGAMAGGAMAGGGVADGAVPGAAGLMPTGAGGQPGMDPAMMAAYSAQMAAAMQAVQAQAGAGGTGMPPGMLPGAMPMPTGGVPADAMEEPGEGGGQPLELSSDLPGELKKGKTVIRNLDWIPGGGTVSPAGADGFGQAMARVAAAMKQAGGSYRLDIYMDKQSGDVVVRTLGPQRLAAVRASLVEGGASPGADGPQIGKSKKDGDPRLEVVRLK